MSHARNYLRSILTPAQWQEYRRLAAQDSQDSTARRRWQYVQRYGGEARLASSAATLASSVATARAWLLRNGYVDESGEWTGKTTES